MHGRPRARARSRPPRAATDISSALSLLARRREMLRACGAFGATALGVGGLAYMARSVSAAGDMMHPAHTTTVRSSVEFKSLVETNVNAGKTVFVRWIASPK